MSLAPKPRALLATTACITVLAAAAVVCCWPLFSQQALPRGSDVSWHAQWASGFLDGLRQGHHYPRWISEANRGFGAPVFVFYPPLSYYLTALIGLCGADLLDSFRIAFCASSFLSGLALFAAARPLTSRAGATLGGVLYILLPYHVLDIYDRFAYAEVVALVWLPLIFLFTRRLAAGEPSLRAWIGLTASYAALVLTHLPAAFMVPLVAGPYALILVLRRRSWRRLWPMAAAVAAALLLAALFVLPWLVEAKQVNLDWRMSGQWNGDWRVNFVYEQLPGVRADPIKPLVASSVTTQLIVGVGSALVLFLRTRRRSGAEPLREEGLAQLALAAWTFLLQVSISRPIWAVVPLLGDLQFPWRFGALQLCASSLLAALAVAPLLAIAKPAVARKRHQGRELTPPSLLAPVGVAAAIVVLAAIPALRFSFELTGHRPYSFDAALSRTVAYAQRITYEYIPRGVLGFESFEKVKVDAARAWLEGDGRIGEITWEAQRRKVEVDARGPVTLRVRTFDYPGWQARLDGVPVAIASQNPLRAIEVAVPAGRHVVELELGSTWDRRLGGWLSAAAAAALLGGLALRRGIA